MVFGSDVTATDDPRLQDAELCVLRKGFARVMTAEQIVAALVGTATPAETPADGPPVPRATEQELRAQEATLTDALRRCDQEVLSRLLAPDYRFTSARGDTWGWGQAVAEMTDPRFEIQDIRVEVEGVVPLHGAGIVTGRSEVDGRIGSQILSGVFRFTHVWRQSGKGWQIVAGHTSRVQPSGVIGPHGDGESAPDDRCSTAARGSEGL